MIWVVGYMICGLMCVIVCRISEGDKISVEDALWFWLIWPVLFGLGMIYFGLWIWDNRDKFLKARF